MTAAPCRRSGSHEAMNHQSLAAAADPASPVRWLRPLRAQACARTVHCGRLVAGEGLQRPRSSAVSRAAAGAAGWTNFFCAALLALAAPALAAPIPFGTQNADIAAREQPLGGFLQDLFGRLGVPVAVEASVQGSVSGSFGGSIEKVYRQVARANNLVEYYDGSVLYIGTPQDMETRTLALGAAESARLAKAVEEMGLADERNKVRLAGSGTLVVSGLRRFVAQVQDMAPGAPAAAGAAGFRVFYLRYAWAQDVTMNFNGAPVQLPGVASTVRALMTGDSRGTAPGTGQLAQGGSVARAKLTGAARPGTLGKTGSEPPLAPAAPAPAAGPGDLPVRVEADARLNAVLVRDAPQRMADYEQLIAALDVEPQVLGIEATIIDINTDKLSELGVNWRGGQAHGSLLFGRGDASDLLLAPGTAAGGVTPVGAGGFASVVLGNAGQFIARVSALQQQGAAKVVSSPQLVALSDVEARFDDVRTFHVRVAGHEDVGLFPVSVGTRLHVTPHVFKDRGDVRIKMLVSIEDGSFSSGAAVDTLPVVASSSLATQAMIFEGESLLVGGITRENTSDGVTKVPVLGDIPVVGGLFRNSRSSGGRVERMFLLTPRLVATRPLRTNAAAPAPAVEAKAPPRATDAPAWGPALRVKDRRGPRTLYARGERYEVEVSVPKDGFLYCYLIDEKKVLHQFFPNPGQRSAAVAGGSTMVFPGSFGFRLSTARNAARETVACVSTSKDLGYTPLQPSDAADEEALRAGFARLQGGGPVQIDAFEVRVE